MRSTLAFLVVAGLSVPSTAQASTITFNTDPFAGSTAPTTPGRQIVGGEPSITFDPATDVFAFDLAFFALGGAIGFINDTIGNVPASGVNVVVLRTFDNDGNTATPFAAGTAADLIAGQLTTPGAGLFIYFNQGLDLARLVYSTDLDDSTSDLKILARLTNFSGAAGQNAMATFTAANFQIVATPVPEPASLMLLASVGGLWVLRRIAHRHARRRPGRQA